MKIDESTFKEMPPELRALFVKCPNPGSDEVVRLFPVTGASSTAPRVRHGNGRELGQSSGWNAHNNKPTQSEQYGDSGSAARFFYCAKASKRDRDEGIDSIRIIDIEYESCENNTTSSGKLARLLVDMGQSPPKVTAEYGTGTKSGIEWSTRLFGNALTEKSQKENKYTTSTATSLTTESKIFNSLIRYITNEYIQGVSLEMESGGSLAKNAEHLNTLIISISAKMASALGVKNVKSRTLLRISESDGKNIHSTVKPTALMRYLVRLVTPPGGTVLDPFTGSGSTGKACVYEGFNFIGIEREEEYAEIARARIEYAMNDTIEGEEDDGQPSLFEGVDNVQSTTRGQPRDAPCRA